MREQGLAAASRVGAAVLPVAVVDAIAQQGRYEALLKRALEPSVDARIVVFPELTSSPQLVEHARELIDAAAGSRLVVAGSFHQLRGGDGANTAIGVVTRSDARLEHDKLAAFMNRDGSKEGIRRSQQITVYEAGPFRVAIAICKDLLDDEVRRLYTRCGVNVVLVPAMSVKTAEFTTAVRGLVKSNQAVTVFANAILQDQSGEQVSPAALLGQPFAGAETISADPEPPTAPALTAFRVGDPEPIPLE